MTWDWQRSDLRYVEGNLTLGRSRLARIAQQFGTPTFVYSKARCLHNVDRLEDALREARVEHRLFYALKANRFAPLLMGLRRERNVGVDVCSPAELEYAVSLGIPEECISFTGTSLSRADYARIARFDKIFFNCDTLHAIETIGRLGAGRAIGLRINPARGVGYGDSAQLTYSGPNATKFGIYADRISEAVELARRHELRIEGIHFHVGCGYLTEQLEAWRDAVRRAMRLVESLGPFRYVNVGGGLGVPHLPTDSALDLKAWAQILAQDVARHAESVFIEPGDYIVKDAGLLLTEVAHSETKCGTHFVGLNAGFNLVIEPAFYGLRCHPVPVEQGRGDCEPATFVGNINEALDVFATDVPCRRLVPGELVALLNAGGYASSMSSNHCMRNEFREVIIDG